MLSQQIYDSWNAKTDADIKALLDNINGPQIPTDVHSTTFKKTVLQKIERRRTDDFKRSRSKTIDPLEDPNGCCFGLCKKKDSEKNRIGHFECKSVVTFESICFTTTKCFTKAIASVKALIQKLSYWESVKPGTDGLSCVGGYAWILSFACQHLIDAPNSTFSMQSHLIDVKEKYQELGQAGELFIELAESFHEITHHMRTDALQILKKLTKKWSITDEHNPLRVRPEAIKAIPRPRKRLGTGLDSPIDVDDDDDVFSVKWSPLTVFIRTCDSGKPKPFGRLHPQDRITVFKKFMQCTVDKVEMAAEDLTEISNEIVAMDMDRDKKVHGRELIYAMLEFSKGSNVPKNMDDKDKRRMVLMLNEFWYSLDVLHENMYILLRLVQETRDIIRTCYIYTDIFYKWHMPNYDAFIPKSRSGNKRLTNTTMQAKEILQKLGSQKKLSETTSILSLMDFSSSIYQGVVLEIPVECDGMTICLRSSENESPSEEPQGLVSGIVDKRKSTIGLCDKKSFSSANKKGH